MQHPPHIIIIFLPLLLPCQYLFGNYEERNVDCCSTMWRTVPTQRTRQNILLPNPTANNPIKRNDWQFLLNQLVRGKLTHFQSPTLQNNNTQHDTVARNTVLGTTRWNGVMNPRGNETTTCPWDRKFQTNTLHIDRMIYIHKIFYREYKFLDLTDTILNTWSRMARWFYRKWWNRNATHTVRRCVVSIFETYLLLVVFFGMLLRIPSA